MSVVLNIFIFVVTSLHVTCRQWYDWESSRGSSNDFLSNTGFCFALRDVLRLRRGALLWGGLPCGPWLGCIQVYRVCAYDVMIQISNAVHW